MESWIKEEVVKNLPVNVIENGLCNTKTEATSSSKLIDPGKRAIESTKVETTAKSVFKKRPINIV